MTEVGHKVEVIHARVTGESPSPSRVDGSGTSDNVNSTHAPGDVGVPTSSATCNAVPVCVCCDKAIDGVRVVADAGAMHQACAYDAMKGANGAFALPAYSFARWVRDGERWALDLWRAVLGARAPRRPQEAA